MTLTLDGLDLPPDLVWVDEFDWTPIEQHKKYTLTGALVIETAQKMQGRPVTLADGDDRVFAYKAQVDALYDKLLITTELMLVLQDGRSFGVTFRHEDKPIEAKPIIYYDVMESIDRYSLVIKLIIVRVY